MEGRSRGFVLIVVMVVLAGLSLLSLSLAARCRIGLSSTSLQLRSAQGRWLADAAVNLALTRIAEDTNATDSWADPWAQLNEEGALQLFADEIEGFPTDWVVECSVIDEQGKVNVKNVDPEMLATIGEVGEWLAPLVADWTDEDDVRRPGGAESADYAALPVPYEAKNEALELIEELRFLLSVSREAFLGEDGDGNYRLDADEDDGYQAWPVDDADGLLDLGPWSLMTVSGDGRININTAPKEVLAVLPLIDEDRAEAIVQYRQSRAWRSAGRDAPFASIEDLREAIPLADWELGVLEPTVCVKSQHFRIVAQVRDAEGLVVTRQEALVERTAERPVVVFYASE